MGRDPGAVVTVEEGHRSARDRILRVGLATTLVNRVVALAVPLVSLPIFLTELGAERYGVWVTVTSLVAVLAVLDLGIGNATLTFLAATRSREARIAAVRTMYRIAVLVTVVLLAGWWLLSAAGWATRLYGAEGIADANALIQVATVGALLQLPLTLVYKVQTGLGRQGSANMAQAYGSVLLLVGLVGLVAAGTSAIVIVVWAAFCPVLVAAVYSAASLWRGREAVRGWRSVPGQPARTQIRVGLPIFIVSMLMLVAQNIDPYLVGRTLGYDSVQEFAVPFRIFAAVSSLAVMLSAPLWALNAEALSRGDVEWVRHRARRVAALGGAVVAGMSLLLVLGGPLLLDLWLGGAVEFDWVVWSAFGVMVVVQSVSGPFFMVQNAIPFMWLQACAYGIILAIVPLKLLALEHGGLAGFVSLLAGVQLVVLLPCAVYGARYVLQKKVKHAA